MLLKYAHVFNDETNDFKATDAVGHGILFGDMEPIRRPQFKTPIALRKEIKAQMDKILNKGIISESSSLWSAPVIFVPKDSESLNSGFTCTSTS